MNQHQGATVGDLPRRTKVAALWQLLGKGSTAGIQLVVGVILARLLLPRDFGLMALAMLVIDFALVLRDVGLGRSLIQREAIEPGHVNAAFLGTLVAAVGLAAVLFVGSPATSRLFHEPNLAPILRLLACAFPASALLSIPYSLLNRDLDFRRTALVDVVGASIYGAVGIAAALLGYGVWSLAWAAVARTVATSIVAFAAARYVPSFRTSLGHFRHLFGFGLGTALVGFLAYGTWNVNYFLIGRYLSTGAVGVYRRAVDLTKYPVYQVLTPLTLVLFPAFSRLQSDHVRARHALRQGLMGTALLSFPVLAILGPCAGDFIPLVLGQQWRGAILATQIMCLATAFTVVGEMLNCFLFGLGRIAIIVAVESAYLAAICVGSIMVVRLGIEAVAWVLVAATVIRMGLYGGYSRTLAGVRLTDLVSGLSVPTVAGVAAYLACVVCLQLMQTVGNQWASLGSASLVGLTAYAAFVWWCPWGDGRKMVGEMAGVVVERLRPCPRPK